MTDLLYSVRGGDGWDLRMSLRSHAANMSDVGRVIVVGEPPEWLSDEAIGIPCGSPYPRKQKNIMLAIVAGMAAAGVDGPCLYSSDDHFVVKPCSADSLPYFARQGLWSRFRTTQDLAATGRPMTHWRASMVRTGAYLSQLGLPLDNWSGHFDTRLDGRELTFAKVAMRSPLWQDFGFEPSSIFIAGARVRDPSIRAVPVRDRKLQGDLESGEALDAWAADSDGFVSVGDSGRAPNFRRWMEARFPEPCRWERA